MYRTHRTLAGPLSACDDGESCTLLFHVDLSLNEADALPEAAVEMLFEAVQPPSELVGTVKYWYDSRGSVHRDYDLPAVVFPDGSRQWWLHGERARTGNKPDATYPDGSRFWAKAGIYRRAEDPDPTPEELRR